MRYVLPAVLLTLVLAAIIKIIRNRGKFKSTFSDKLFLALIIIIATIPGSYLHNKEVNRWENRNYYPLPKFWNEGKFNRNFGHDFENYFSDRIVGRKDLIKIDNFISKLNARQQNKRVLLGKDGWLFYKYDNSISHFKNEILFDDTELAGILHNLERIREINPNLYVFIAPDKNKIYGEFYPDEIKKTNPDDMSRANQLVKYITEHSNIPIVYPYEALHKNKGAKLLYYKHGTHWNGMAGEIGFMELFKVIRKKYPQLHYLKKSKFVEDNTPDIDLEGMMPDFKDYDNTQYWAPLVDGKPKNKLKVFVLRDSFYEAMSPYFIEVFGSVDNHLHKKLKTFDFEQLKNYDIVVIEAVERLAWYLKFEGRLQ